MTNHLLDIDVMIQAAWNAGDTAQRWQQEQLGQYGKVTSTRKPDGSIVTDADRIAQDIIEGILMKMDPQAIFIGEEGAAGKLKLSAFTPGTRCFVVDPIDGTSSYPRGSPVSARDGRGRRAMGYACWALHLPERRWQICKRCRSLWERDRRPRKPGAIRNGTVAAPGR